MLEIIVSNEINDLQKSYLGAVDRGVALQGY